MGPDFDIIVIGGSANGSQAAHTSAKRGARVAVIEEHPTTGLPEHCSGLFSYWGLEKIDSYPPDNIVFNYDIYGSRIISPNGKTLTVKKNYKHALVCDRAAYDRFLLERSVKVGVTLFQPFRATHVKRVNGSIYVTASNSNHDQLELTCSLLISAEGVRGTMVSQLGLAAPPVTKTVNAAQFYMNDLSGVDHELVEVYQSQKYAKEFFAWLIPMSSTSAKIGLGTSRKAASKQLAKMISEHPVLKEHCKNADITRKTGGRIPTTGPVKQTYGDNLLLVGDVAGQTKPTTGGGVILGGIAAQIAGNVAADAVTENRFDANYLKRYEKLWKKEMHNNLRLMRLVRLYMDKLTDNEMNSFFASLASRGILEDIQTHGHVDNQGKLVLKFMRFWRLYPFYLRTSGRLLSSLIRM